MSRWLYLMLTLDDNDFHIPQDDYLKAVKKICGPREHLLFEFVEESGAGINASLRMARKDCPKETSAFRIIVSCEVIVSLFTISPFYHPETSNAKAVAVFSNRRWILSGYCTNHRRLDIFGKNLIFVNYVCVAYLSGSISQ